MIDELVKITNTDDSNDLSLIVGDDRLVIKPGKSRIVPFTQAAGWFGHPLARDAGKVRDRRDTYERLRTFYGFCSGFHTADDWASQLPTFRVETQDGEYIPMVLDDPEGVEPLPEALGGTADAPREDAELSVLREALAAQQAQIERLSKLITTRELADAPGVDPNASDIDSTDLPEPSDDAPGEDTPRATRLGKPK